MKLVSLLLLIFAMFACRSPVQDDGTINWVMVSTEIGLVAQDIRDGAASPGITDDALKGRLMSLADALELTAQEMRKPGSDPKALLEGAVLAVEQIQSAIPGGKYPELEAGLVIGKRMLRRQAAYIGDAP